MYLACILFSSSVLSTGFWQKAGNGCLEIAWKAPIVAIKITATFKCHPIHISSSKHFKVVATIGCLNDFFSPAETIFLLCEPPAKWTNSVCTREELVKVKEQGPKPSAVIAAEPWPVSQVPPGSRGSTMTN